MTKAIEAAARAICAAYGDDPDREGPFAEWVSGSAYEAQAQAAITAYLAAMKAEGFVMVPVEPTARQIAFGWKHAREHSGVCYKAMIAASTPHDDGGE